MQTQAGLMTVRNVDEFFWKFRKKCENSLKGK